MNYFYTCDGINNKKHVYVCQEIISFEDNTIIYIHLRLSSDPEAAASGSEKSGDLNVSRVTLAAGNPR